MSRLTDEELGDIYTKAAVENQHLGIRSEINAALRAVADAAVAADRAGRGEPVGEVVTVGGYPDDSEHRVKWLVKFKELKNGDLLYTRTHHTEDNLEMVLPEKLKHTKVTLTEYDTGYIEGWNDCRETLIAAHEANMTPRQQAQPTEAVDCIWSAHNDVHMPNTFDGSCGVRWSFIDGDPIGNGMRFCPYCGGRVRLSAHEAKRRQS